jgi:protein phosphatase
MSYLVLSDIHGCFDEMIQLLNKAGWDIAPTLLGEWDDHGTFISLGEGLWTVKPPGDEKIVILGDLGDRGPKSDLVFEFAMRLSALGLLRCIVGNHDDKLRRYLLGNPVKFTHGINKTIEQIDRRGPEFKSDLLEFLSNLDYKFECESFIGVHAALVRSEKPKNEKQFALYGVVDNKAGLDENGFPRRLLNWFNWYDGSVPVIFGHIVHQEITEYKTVNSKAIAIDTGAVTGGKLSAIRMPEQTIFQVDCPKYHDNPDPSYRGPVYEEG